MEKNVILDNRDMFNKEFISLLEQIRILNILKSMELLTENDYKKARVQIENLYNG